MREDQDRLLGLILPGVLLADAALASVRFSTLVRTLSMSLIAAAVAPALLWGSSYVAELAGPGSAVWPPAERIAILAGLGVSLFALWQVLAWAETVSESARVGWSQALAIVGASACVMLSGYASGGMNGLPIAGAVAGVAVVAPRVPRRAANAGAGVGPAALFAVLLSGWAFGELRTDAAVLLFLSPLLCALPEIPPLAQLGARARSAIGLGLVLAATAGVTGLTIRRFLAG